MVENMLQIACVVWKQDLTTLRKLVTSSHLLEFLSEMTTPSPAYSLFISILQLMKRTVDYDDVVPLIMMADSEGMESDMIIDSLLWRSSIQIDLFTRSLVLLKALKWCVFSVSDTSVVVYN